MFTIKTSKHRSMTLLTLDIFHFFSSVFIIDFEQVNVNWANSSVFIVNPLVPNVK